MIVSYLVAKTLRSNDGNLIADSLVGLEVESQLWVVSLDDDLCGLLDGLGANATHVCGICRRMEGKGVVVELKSGRKKVVVAAKFLGSLFEMWEIFA
jgi:hypothetical protein